MLSYLESQNRLQLDYLAKNTIKGHIEEIKIDLITHSYPLVEDLQVMEGIRMAGLSDIAAMKLNAIMGNGTRLKDFIDIAYLSCYIPLKKNVDAFEQKYSSRNPLLVLKAIAYHKDINFGEPIKMLTGKLSWKKIEKRLADMENHPLTIFREIP